MAAKQIQHVKTRFCPSPTGLLYLGHLKTALLSALLAKGTQGEFLLRIEDADSKHSEPRYDKQLQKDLQWLGLLWQEGPGRDLGRGPYHQSERQYIYDDYYHRLKAMNMSYPCFCVENKLMGQSSRYPGTCQALTQEDIEEKLTQGLKPRLRFRVPEEGEVNFSDLVHSEQSFQTKDMDDFVIRRADGTSSFLFCNAIDDALMEVTHVLRSENHLTDTPRQILILNTLGLPIPKYGHIAFMITPDGGQSLVELRRQGYLPLAIINYLARLGHDYEHDELLSLEDLATQFDFSSVSKCPSKYDEEQLHFWQKKSIDSLTDADMWDWLGIEIFSAVPKEKRHIFLEIIKPYIEYPQDALYWLDILLNEDIIFEKKSGAAPEYYEQALIVFERHGAQIQMILDHLKAELGLEGKALLQPLRLALTGRAHGPELEKMGMIMSAAAIKKRLLKAKERAENI